jgi:predicted permease
MLIAWGGTVAGFLLAVGGVAVLRRMLPADTPRLDEIAVDGRVLMLCALVGVAVGLLSLLPTLAATRADPNDALRAGRSGDVAGRTGNRWRGALVSTEIALALVLVIGAGLMVKTLWRLSNVNPGFQAERALAFRLQPAGRRSSAELQQYFARVLEETRAIPGVVTAGGIHHLPMSGFNWWANVEIEGRPVATGEALPRAGWRIIAGDYLRAMGVPLVAGRVFEQRDDAEGERVALINDMLAQRLFPGESPLGRRIRAGNATRGEWVRIVGVTGNVRHQSVVRPPDPEMYFPITQVGMSFLTIVARTSIEPLALADPARRAVRAIDATVPISELRALQSVVWESTVRQRLVLRLLVVFAGVGLVLGAVGIYGVVAFGVTQRTHEIGVRIALGARRRTIVGMVISDGLRHAVAGLGVGALAAFWLTRAMRGVVYDVSTTDPLTYVAVAAIVLAVSIAASWIPARRAARVDPLTAMRNT